MEREPPCDTAAAHTVRSNDGLRLHALEQHRPTRVGRNKRSALRRVAFNASGPGTIFIGMAKAVTGRVGHASHYAVG